MSAAAIPVPRPPEDGLDDALDDAPVLETPARRAWRRLKRRKGAMVGLCVSNIVIFGLAKLYYVWRNRTIRRANEQIPEEERALRARPLFHH